MSRERPRSRKVSPGLTPQEDISTNPPPSLHKLHKRGRSPSCAVAACKAEQRACWRCPVPVLAVDFLSERSAGSLSLSLSRSALPRGSALRGLQAIPLALTWHEGGPVRERSPGAIPNFPNLPHLH